MLSTTNNNNKPIIEKIDFGEHEAEVKRIWNGEPPTKLLEDMKNGKPGVRKYYAAGTIKSRYGRINKLLGYGNNKVGFCSRCGINFNTHIMKQQLDGITLITRFCEHHIPKEFDTK